MQMGLGIIHKPCGTGQPIAMEELKQNLRTNKAKEKNLEKSGIKIMERNVFHEISGKNMKKFHFFFVFIQDSAVVFTNAHFILKSIWVKTSFKNIIEFLVYL